MSRFRLWVALWAPIAALGCFIDHTPATRAPDVLVVVLDTVRADRLSAYGYPRDTSPKLAAIAANSGVLFEDVTAPGSWTWPSHASLFTGELPWVHGAHLAPPEAGDTGLGQKNLMVTPLREDLPTLAERLSEAGYATVAHSSNGWLHRDFGLMRGFDVAEHHANDQVVEEAATAAIREPRDKPLFLFINLTAAHSPFELFSKSDWVKPHWDKLQPLTTPKWLLPYMQWTPRVGVKFTQKHHDDAYSGVAAYMKGELELSDWGREMLSDLYDAGVQHVDHTLGGLFLHWAEQHPDSIVVITSDHGEYLGERGQLEHRGSVYPEVLKIPLVIAAPGRLPEGKRIATPVQLQDLYPTLLELTGVDTRPGSLVPVIAGAERPGPILAAAWPDRHWAKVVGGRFTQSWKLYQYDQQALIWSRTGDVEFYDLSDDPRMQSDRAEARPTQVTELQAQAETFFVEATAPVPAAPLEMSDEARESLRALGYIE